MGKDEYASVFKMKMSSVAPSGKITITAVSVFVRGNDSNQTRD